MTTTENIRTDLQIIKQKIKSLRQSMDGLDDTESRIDGFLMSAGSDVTAAIRLCDDAPANQLKGR